MHRKWGVVVLVVGVVLVALAGVVRWVAAPKLAVMPASQETTRIYTGTATMIANPTALTGTTYGPGILRDQPITVRHYTKALDTDGGSAVVFDQRTVSIPGYQVANLKYRFGLDRKTFEAAAWPRVAPHQGLTINWPIGTQRHDYTGWVIDTKTTAPLRYRGETNRGGVDTYVFTTTVPTQVIKDPAVLATLPRTQTKQQLLATTPALQLPTSKLLKLQKTVDKLPNPVPMAYTYRAKATFWIAPASGIVVDAKQHEVRTANFRDGNRLIPSAPVMDMTYQDSPGTLVAAADDARHTAAKLRLIQTTVPLVLLGLGTALVVVGIVLILRRRPAPPTAPAGAPQRELVRAP